VVELRAARMTGACSASPGKCRIVGVRMMGVGIVHGNAGQDWTSRFAAANRAKI